MTLAIEGFSLRQETRTVFLVDKYIYGVQVYRESQFQKTVVDNHTPNGRSSEEVDNLYKMSESEIRNRPNNGILVRSGSWHANIEQNTYPSWK